jgi:1,4-dihydroxy-2-naphthoyl-CoA hydrolase
MTADRDDDAPGPADRPTPTEIRDAMPFAALVGIELVEAAADVVRGRLEWSPERCTGGDLLHGGAVMALADNMGGTATFLNLPPGAATTTIESKTNFFAACALGETITTETTPLHRGRTTMVWQTRITRADGKLAALVTQTQLVIPGKK